MFKSTNYLKKQEIEKRKAMIELRRKKPHDMYKSACDGGRNGRRPYHLIAKLNTEIAMALQRNSKAS